jgi:hypothetical protein
MSYLSQRNPYSITTTQPQVFGSGTSTISIILVSILIALIGGFIGYQLWVGYRPMSREGFGGPVKGSGSPDCLRSSTEAAQLYDIVNSKDQMTETGPDDLREFNVLIGKLTCFKRDLLSSSGIVEATRTQPFSTSHDMEAIAETTARCFAKTIPDRDLRLSLEKWKTRGNLLLKRLCVNMNDTAHKETMALFKAFMSDISSLAANVCLNGDAVIAGKPGPRMVDGYEPACISNLSVYKGYF